MSPAQSCWAEELDCSAQPKSSNLRLCRALCNVFLTLGGNAAIIFLDSETVTTMHKHVQLGL